MVKVKSKSAKKNGFWNKLRRIILKSIMWFFIVTISWVVLARFIPVIITPLMFIRATEAIFDGKTPKIQQSWISIKKISPNMVQAVIASEDNLFVTHHGFDTRAIEKAIKHNEKSKRIRGGSTISQQTAKNVFLWPDRSWFRKGLEVYFTVLIEFIWGKKRIMEVYLNVIETGNGIYGVQKAAHTYFGTSAKNLSRSQAASIAVCLPNPRKFNPAQPSSYIQRRKNHIVSLMGKIPQAHLN